LKKKTKPVFIKKIIEKTRSKKGGNSKTKGGKLFNDHYKLKIKVQRIKSMTFYYDKYIFGLSITYLDFHNN